MAEGYFNTRITSPTMANSSLVKKMASESLSGLMTAGLKATGTTQNSMEGANTKTKMKLKSAYGKTASELNGSLPSRNKLSTLKDGLISNIINLMK